MNNRTPQSYASHKKLVPGFHFVTLGILLVNILWWGQRSIWAFSMDRLMLLVLAVGLFALGVYTRLFATRNQDRIIRLEERTRLKELLPEDLRGHIEDFSLDQLVAMRFASDEEITELARKVLAERADDRESIKRMIRTWRPDYQRV